MCLLCTRSVVVCHRILHNKSSYNTLNKSLYTYTTRNFATVGVPVLPESQREPDNIYRRPAVLPPSQPLHEHDDLMWNDAQAPEPCLDEFPNAPPRMYGIIDFPV